MTSTIWCSTLFPCFHESTSSHKHTERNFNGKVSCRSNVSWGGDMQATAVSRWFRWCFRTKCVYLSRRDHFKNAGGRDHRGFCSELTTYRCPRRRAAMMAKKSIAGVRTLQSAKDSAKEVAMEASSPLVDLFDIFTHIFFLMQICLLVSLSHLYGFKFKKKKLPRTF